MVLNPDEAQAARRRLGPTVIGNFEALHRQVRQAAGDGWHTLPVTSLRDAIGRKRLASNVRQDIATACQAVGLEVDGAIPDRQDYWVRVRAIDMPTDLTVESATSQRDTLLLEIKQLRTDLDEMSNQLLERLDALSRAVDHVEQTALRLPT